MTWIFRASHFGPESHCFQVFSADSGAAVPHARPRYAKLYQDVDTLASYSHTLKSEAVGVRMLPASVYSCVFSRVARFRWGSPHVPHTCMNGNIETHVVVMPGRSPAEHGAGKPEIGPQWAKHG